MNFKVDRNLFLNELFYLQGAVAPKQMIPILSHVLMEAGPGKITMRATDLDLTITTECEADVREGGSVCLPGRKLLEVFKSLPQSEIEIKSNDLQQATITCTSSRFRMNGAAAESFPEAQEYSGKFIEIDAGVFSRFIPRVIHAVGQEGSRYMIHGAKLEISNQRIRMVATDGHRLALIEREGRFNENFEVLIPKKTLTALAKLCVDSEEILQIGKTDNHIYFNLGKREIVSSLLAGVYPDYSAVLPKQNHIRFTISRDQIYPAVRRVALMADEKQHTIKLEIGKGSLRISSQTSELGEAGENVSIDYTGKKITTGFNATYLSDFFSAVDEDEILFELKSGETPTQLSVESAYQDRCLAVVMPMRL